MAAGDTSTRSLERTPTWALATVCFLIISISIILEHCIHLLTNRRRKKGLSDAVERLKSELMLLGFVSLLLAMTQVRISNICIPTKLADNMLPCKQVESQTAKIQEYENYDNILWRQDRRLADDDDDKDATNSTSAVTDSCTSQGKVSLVAPEGIQQLQIFIFVLAVMQIVYSVLTMALCRAKMRRWKAWEKETQTIEYQVANDPNRFRLARQTTFGRRHTSSCTKTPVDMWIKCFFRQFFHTVAKVDYLTLRHGFISAHLSTRHNNFNFQKYIQRSLEEDFKTVISVSPVMRFLAVIFLLVDVHGWNVYLWVSCVPLLTVLILGTKLEAIVSRMALQINNQNNVIKGAPLVQPNDNLFWFGQPRFVLTLLHYTLFMNAFALAHFIWVTLQFGFNSCYHEHTAIIVTRVVLAVTVQFLCSYITLPLYALVTQMGSQFKSKALGEQMSNILKQWHSEVKERRKKQEQFLQYPRTCLSEAKEKRVSPIDFPSLPRLTSSVSESINFTNKGEITEEQENIVKEEASSSRGPSRTVIIEMPIVRRDQLMLLQHQEEQCQGVQLV